MQGGSAKVEFRALNPVLFYKFIKRTGFGAKVKSSTLNPAQLQHKTLQASLKNDTTTNKRTTLNIK